MNRKTGETGETGEAGETGETGESMMRNGDAWRERLLAAVDREGLPPPRSCAWERDDAPGAPRASLRLAWPPVLDDEGEPWGVEVVREYWTDAGLGARARRWDVPATRRGPNVYVLTDCLGRKFGHGIRHWDESRPGVGDTVAAVVEWLRGRYAPSPGPTPGRAR